MLKSIVIAGALLSLLAPSTAFASVPRLSGAYLYSKNQLCPMPITVRYASPSSGGSPFVIQVIGGNGSNTIKLGGGTFSFAQSGAVGSGTARINGTTAYASPVVLTETGGGVTGTDGQTIQSKAETGSAPFSQTATTLTLKTSDGTQNFHIYYGKVAAGIVQNAVFVGVDSKGCAEQYSLTHN
jgi:hypothetical protein